MPALVHGLVSLDWNQSLIGDSETLERVEKDTGVHPLPDMFFAGTRLDYSCGDVSISISSVDAVRGCLFDPSPPSSLHPPVCLHPTSRRLLFSPLQVMCAAEWSANRTGVVARPVETNHDWTFTSSYWGSVAGEGRAVDRPVIPTDRLMDQTLPVKQYGELTLWEDELGDNGHSKMSIKFRLMDTGFFFILMRFELVVHGVINRVIETRIFHDYQDNNGEVFRQFKWTDNGKEMVLIDEVLHRESTRLENRLN
jgi:hypothetical protein